MKGAIFDPVVVGWDGREFTIPPHRVMGAIHRIERIVTLDALSRYAQENSTPLGILASAYGAVLRYAGARVADEEIYEQLFLAEDKAVSIIEAVTTLMMMMIPNSARNQPSEPTPVREDDHTGNLERAAADLSSPPTKQQSVSAGSTPNNSGGSIRRNGVGSRKRRRR